MKILLIIILSLFGCGLLKKTTKNSSTQYKSSSHMEADVFLLKKNIKETQINTYWTDSGFYQIARIRELQNQSGVGKIKTKEKEDAKTKVIAKQTEPLKLWIYMVLVVIMVGFYMGYRRL